MKSTNFSISLDEGERRGIAELAARTGHATLASWMRVIIRRELANAGIYEAQPRLLKARRTKAAA